MRIEVLIDVKTVLGEGPLWDVDEQRLYFIDSFGCNVFRCTTDGREVRAWDVPAKIGSMALRRQGGAVLSLAGGFHFLDFKTGECELIVDPEPNKSANRINDGKVDKRGRFIAGSRDRPKSLPAPARRSHYRFKRTMLESGRPHLLFRGQLVGRNLGLRLRHGNRGSFQQAHVLQDRPLTRRAADGSTVDAEGCLWNAQVYDGKIIRYTPDGRVEGVIEMPVKKVTSVMFGGPDLDILYVTSMAKPPLPRFPGDGVLRGSLFAIYDLGIRGVPEPRFAG